MAEIILGQPKEESRSGYIYAENMHLVYRDVLAKLFAYRERFGEAVDHTGPDDHEYLLPLSVCQSELRLAERQLLFEGTRVKEAKMVSSDILPDEPAGFEISANGRRFSIPRDEYIPHPFRDLTSIETGVVSVLEWTKWPINPRYEITPKISDALLDIATGPLIHDVRDLAVYLRLGDKLPFDKKNINRREVFERALERFGVDDIEQVKQIVKSIGLKIIDTSERFSKVVSVESTPGNVEREKSKVDFLSTLGLKAMLIASRYAGDGAKCGANARTEVDALLEAIHKTV